MGNNTHFKYFKCDVFVCLQVDLVSELKPYDVKKLLILDDTPVSLMLEGSHVGRGARWYVQCLVSWMQQTFFYLCNYIIIVYRDIEY